MSLGLPDLPALKTPEPLPVSHLNISLKQMGRDLNGLQVFWLGNTGGRRRYRLVDSENKESEIAVIVCLSDDEKIIFRAFQDWFSAAIKKISEASRGYFTFDVLQFAVGDEPWSWSDFAALMIAHAKKLGVGDRRLIQFGSLWGVLNKHTDADFGRIESKLSLDFFKASPDALARFVKKQMASPVAAQAGAVIFCDLSRTALLPEESDFELFRAALRPKGDDFLPAQSIFYEHGASHRLKRV